MTTFRNGFHRYFLYATLLLNITCFQQVIARKQLCDVETGQSNIILDIEESRGSYIGQQTRPAELPIYGDPQTEIALDLIFPKGNPTFVLNGKTLQLLQPLDRDEENLSHIVFQVSCTVLGNNKKRNIPIIVRVSDVNDNAPYFLNTPYEVTVPESTPIGTTVFRNLQALDKDAGVNGLVEYFIVKGNVNVTEDQTMTVADGYETFTISYPHQGQVTVARSLDYERIQRFFVTVVATDRARNQSERLSSTTTLTINIADSDDQDPSFIYRGCDLLDGACINAEYFASVPAGSLQGVLTVTPERIQAIDLDTISSPIRYSFASGIPENYADYFEIDEQTGVLKQIKAVDTSTAKKYNIIVKAEEVSANKRFTNAKLTINVKPVDANPPIITASSVEGYVDENSVIGTKVMDAAGKPIVLQTSDADLGEEDVKPAYIYELTTPSFEVTAEGYLLVNEENLDRDPPAPGRFMFQVVSREPRTNVASAPLTLNVQLRDVNDNAPKLAKIAPISIAAGDGKRLVTQVSATDNDEGANAVISYSIYHVSNNGMQKFSIDEKTGEIMTTGRLLAGAQYSITVQATDMGGLSSQAIAEVLVTPGPNTKPPRFEKSVYEVHVSEGVEINSTVTVVHADDPENDPVIYSIMSGNDLRQFAVGQEDGVIVVIRKLDRESLTRYQLLIKAEDNGGLSSSATVNIKVTDINDKNPEFDESTLPYVFQTPEGKANEFVGIVHATDADEGINAQITYSLPEDIPFAINGSTGEIHTTTALDYERQNEYRFVVTAKDGAPDARLGTASVTVSVRDLPDEVPKFTDTRIDVRVPENVPDMLVTTVQAYDPDTMPEITYVLRKGSSELFKVLPQTGELKTTIGLDYEKEKHHELVIGTIENDGNEPGDTITVVVEVEDRNDVRPLFVSVPEPITINDDQAIGSKIATMPAIDGDGSSPGNVLRYDLVGRGKALKYFQVDSDTGVIRVRNDLQKEEDTEYQLDIRASDMGEPSLSSVATLPIFVRHMLTDPIEQSISNNLENGGIISQETQGLAFTDDSYTTSVLESTPLNTSIKFIQIINSKTQSNATPAFKCEIATGNEQQQFGISIEDRGCGILLLQPLDYENKTAYSLELQLSSHKYLVNPQKHVATLKILVQDENDNAPVFKFNRQHEPNDTYYAVVTSDMDIDTNILQVRAYDRDSGKFGKLRFRLLDEEDNNVSDDNLPASYFSIAEDTGTLRTAKLFRGEINFPLIFLVEARDNDGQLEGSLASTARIVINQISDVNRMALVFSDAAPNEIKNQQLALEELLQEKSNGLLSGIERLSNRKQLNENGTLFENTGATDVWFYLIDPKTERILKRSDMAVQELLFDATARSELNFAASSLARATAEGIHGPLESKAKVHQVKAAVAINEELFPYALLAVALLVLIVGIIAIIYICVSWSKYKTFKQRMRQYSTPSPSRYDPVIINSQASNSDTLSNLKEYETQVLAMAVPPDGDDDLQLDFSAKNHAFSLDNVSYITHKEHNGSFTGGQTSPSHSEATTATLSTLRRNNQQHNNNNINMLNNYTLNNRQNTFNRTLEMNARNNANPLANGNLPGTLTLGRLKHQNDNHYQNSGYKLDSVSRNNLINLQNSTFNTLGTRRNTHNDDNSNERVSNTLGRNNYASNQPITNPLFASRSNGDLSHLSSTNDNVTFGKREYGAGFSYLNDLDRSEVETTTEL